MTEPRVFTTAEWGARAPKRSFTQQPAKGIVIHNMENANRAPQTGDAEVQAAFRIARANQRSHMDDRGFSDTGQHFTISRGGIILEGRHGSLAAARIGQVVDSAHAGVNEQNKFWFGIELEGDNQQSFVVTSQQFDALTGLCAFLAHQSHLDPPKIEPHNKFHPTTCPGHIVEHLDDLRARVQHILDGTGGATDEDAGSGGAHDEV